MSSHFQCFKNRSGERAELVSFGDTLTSSGDLWCAMEYHTPHNNSTVLAGAEGSKSILWSLCEASRKYTNELKDKGTLPVYLSFPLFN